MWEAKYLENQCVSIHPRTSSPLIYPTFVCFPARTCQTHVCTSRPCSKNAQVHIAVTTIIFPCFCTWCFNVFPAIYQNSDSLSPNIQVLSFETFPTTSSQHKILGMFLQSPNNYLFALFLVFLVLTFTLFRLQGSNSTLSGSYLFTIMQFPPFWTSMAFCLHWSRCILTFHLLLIHTFHFTRQTTWSLNGIRIAQGKHQAPCLTRSACGCWVMASK